MTIVTRGFTYNFHFKYYFAKRIAELSKKIQNTETHKTTRNSGSM